MAQSITRRPVMEVRATLVPLTSTAGVNLFGQPVPVGGRNRLYTLEGSVAVTTAATDITVEVRWTDPTAGSQTAYAFAESGAAISATSLPVGVTGFSKRLAAAAGTTVTVTVTAGTANQATVSAALRGA